MKLVWSPASNVFLYGATTNVPLARSLGVTVALAPDWSLGGGPTMLDELRFAQAWDAQHWNASLTARDLVTWRPRTARVPSASTTASAASRRATWRISWSCRRAAAIRGRTSCAPAPTTCGS